MTPRNNGRGRQRGRQENIIWNASGKNVMHL
jgi:hypothetical protein